VAFGAVLGISRAGAVWCPVNPRNEAAENRELLALLDCRCLIFAAAFAPLVAKIAPDLPELTTLVCLDGYLYIVDRLKDMIITGGFDVYSAEVEQAVLAHPAVLDRAVVGLPDDKRGERVTAIIQPLAGRDVTAEPRVTREEGRCPWPDPRSGGRASTHRPHRHHT
jgi:acyl-CoA synthetase (AMP-forming)/AMP-acid ligase II